MFLNDFIILRRLSVPWRQCFIDVCDTVKSIDSFSHHKAKQFGINGSYILTFFRSGSLLFILFFCLHLILNLINKWISSYLADAYMSGFTNIAQEHRSFFLQSLLSINTAIYVIKLILKKSILICFAILLLVSIHFMGLFIFFLVICLLSIYFLRSRLIWVQNIRISLRESPNALNIIFIYEMIRLCIYARNQAIIIIGCIFMFGL